MLEKILNRWKFLLDQFEAEPKAILAKELLKIMPSKDNFTVDWRMSEGFDEDTKIYRFNYAIYLSPIQSVEEGDPVDLYDFFVRVISNMSAEDLESLNESLESMDKEMFLPYRLDPMIIPCLVLTPEIGVLVFKVRGFYEIDEEDDEENEEEETQTEENHEEKEQTK